MTRDVVSVAPDCMLNDAVTLMQQHSISFLIIASNRKPLGVLSERDIVRLAREQVNPKQLKISDVMTSPVITVGEATNIFQAYDTINTKKIRHIVVLDQAGRITGVTTLSNILGGLSIEYFIELKQVSNIMSQNICTLNPGDSIQQAIQLMAEKRISCVVVATNGKPVGIITERDITRLFAGSQANYDASVESMMIQPVRTIDANVFIPQANTIMRDEKLRHLVIVDASGKLSGLISQSDVARRIEEHYVDYLRTLLKQQDQKLQYEHARFSILFEHNPNAVVSCDVNGNIVDINQAYNRLSGYDLKDVVGRPLVSFIHPEDAARTRSIFQQTNEDKNTHTEFRLLSKSQQFIDVFSSCLSVYTGHSQHRIYSIIYDISDRKLADQRVRVAEEKAQLLAKAVEAAGDSVIITDLNGTIEFVNAAFTRITGYTADEAVGNKPSILKSGEQDAQFYAQMWNAITAGETWQSRLVDRRKNGEFFPAELTISPVRNTAGDITHFVGIKRDLTDREELEEKFYQAQKMEAIGTLVGGIAHDFNNMLAGMTGNLYLAKKRIKGMSEIVQKLDNVEQLSMRAADMIQQLLTFARKDRVSIKPIPFTPFIKETLKLLRASVPENIAMHEEICTDALQVMGDGTLLHQVLMNLVSNACDALEGVEHPCMTVGLELFQADESFAKVRADFKAGAYAHLSVRDNGCGIPKKQIEHLFEPFFTTKEQGKGTGLGLAMVFGAVKTHQGFVEVDSTHGQGTVFHIYLPLLKHQTRLAESDCQTDLSEHGHGETILFVDDQQQVLETGKEVLESLGYQVLTATNGQQAVDVFEAHAAGIDLCILDIIMPVMDGSRAAEHMRQIRPEIPIVFSTGYDKLSRVNMADETVISKPFPIASLSRLIRRQLDS